MRSIQPFVLALCLAAPAGSVNAEAQGLPGRVERPAPVAQSVITVSGDSLDHLRMAQVTGRAPLMGLLLRSTSSLTQVPARGFSVLLPHVTTITNSELPFGQNDGALWAGKGYNVRAIAGFAAAFGPVKIIVAPEFVSATNYSNTVDVTDLRFSRPLPSTRSPFSSPFNVVPYSIDLPYRFGDASIQKIHPGQSSITLGTAVQAGFGTENEWWGPAQRNPLILSDNAPGFPHAFIRTGRPLRSPIGLFEGRWIVGGLKESDYFNTDPADDVRSLSAFSLAWKQRPSSGFTFGIQRSVFAPVDGYGGVAGNSFDFITGVGHPNALPASDSTQSPGPDQIFSLFAHWALPRYGLETYIEWGRADFPKNLRELLTEPNHSRGYTTGLQWVGTRTDSSPRIRLQAEFTNVEQSSTYRFRPNGSFYTSRAVIQGYTNEGQMLGAGIGPGSSGQFIAMDYFTTGGGFQFGGTFGRTRFNNDAFFLKSNPHRCFHDVTVYPGLRSAIATRYFRLRGDYSKVTRYNTFWQRVRGCGSDESAIGDRSSHHFSVTLSTLRW
jgi:hypothetical protein